MIKLNEYLMNKKINNLEENIKDLEYQLEEIKRLIEILLNNKKNK
tara:strand:- start:1766 stop:1900 length:135 start_codon:yes stop_codon:yes gene_type:complete